MHIYSGYRSYSQQLTIWNNKFNRALKQGLSSAEALIELLKYSAIPSTSRHHWGTDIDIVGDKTNLSDPLVPANYQPAGVYAELSEFLQTNAHKFSYYQAYPADKKRSGFAYEPWHYSFKPLAKEFLNCFLEINWVEYINKTEINGSELFSENFITNYKHKYILGIAKQLSIN